MIFCGLTAEFTLSDENNKTIEAGECVYINNTSGIDGFSVDFNKQLFADGGLVKDEGNRILLGCLRDDLKSGTVDTVIMNTIEGMDYLELKITPAFSKLDISEFEKKDTILSGFISFQSRGKSTLSGIDSVKIILFGGSTQENKTVNVFISDDSDPEKQLIDFEVRMPSEEDYYSISVAYYSLSLADTVFYTAGFSNRENVEYPKNLLILDSRSRVMTENLSDAYNDNRFMTVKTFYEKCDSKMIKVDNDGMIVLVNIDGGFILEDLNLFSKIKEEAKRVPVFIFTSGLCGYLAKEENRSALDYFSMLFKADFASAEISDFALCEGIESKEGIDAEIVSLEDGRYASFIKNDNIFLFLFLPEKIDIDQLSAIKKNSSRSVIKERMGSLSSVIDIEYDGYGEYSVDIFDVKGSMIISQLIGELPSTAKSIDMSEFLEKDEKVKPGIYSFRIKKNNETIKCGKFYYIFH